MKYPFWKNSGKWLLFGAAFIIFIAIALGETSVSVKPRLTKVLREAITKVKHPEGDEERTN